MRFKRSRWFLTLSFLLVAPRARAADPAAAQTLFDDAKNLMAEGRYTEACPRFEESERADPGLGTQFHLADCFQHLGRNASAWALFRDVESQAQALGQSGRERVAHDRATALLPWLSKLVITPHGASTTPGLTIRRDGTPVGREQWDLAVPIDPGAHAVTVVAPGKQPWETTVDVPPDAKILTIDLPALADLPDAPAVAVAGLVPPPRPGGGPYAPGAVGVASRMPADAVPDTPVLDDRGGAQRAIGWFLVGAGVIGLASGVYFGVQWADDRDQSNAHCVGDVCDAVGSQLRHDAATQGRTSAVTAGAGGAALLLGVVLAATAPSPRIVEMQSGRLVRFTPVVDAHGGGLGVEGAF